MEQDRPFESTMDAKQGHISPDMKRNYFIVNRNDFSTNQDVLENEKTDVLMKTQFEVSKPAMKAITEALDTNTSPPVTSQPQTKHDRNTMSTRSNLFYHCDRIASCQESLHDTSECQVVNAIHIDNPDPVISGGLSESTEHQNVEVNMEPMSTIAPLLDLLTLVCVLAVFVCFALHRQVRQACPGSRLEACRCARLSLGGIPS